EHLLAGIDRQVDLGALMAVRADAALARADELDAAYASTGVVGPFHGWPIALNDTTSISGSVTTSGSQRLADSPVQAEDDPGAQSAKTAGAVLVGKTTIPEFALSCHSANSISDPARNPRNPELTAGALPVELPLL